MTFGYRLPTDTRLDRAANILMATGVSTTLFGLAMTLCGPIIVDTLIFSEIQRVHWDGPPPPEFAVVYDWSHRAIGALAAGLSIVFVPLAHIPLRRGERWAWWTILTGVGGWHALSWVSTTVLRVWALGALDAGFFIIYALGLVVAWRALDDAEARGTVGPRAS